MYGTGRRTARLEGKENTGRNTSLIRRNRVIILAVTLPIKPECREEAKAIALQMTAETHKEPGVLRYTFHYPVDDSDTLFVYEEWKDQAALDFHNNSDHMKVFQAAIAGVLNGDVSLQKYEVA
jgi:quinol monooxygenase YgiN